MYNMRMAPDLPEAVFDEGGTEMPGLFERRDDKRREGCRRGRRRSLIWKNIVTVCFAAAVRTAGAVHELPLQLVS